MNVQNCLVANNYITISGINPYWGIQVSNSHNTSIIFNTVNVLNSNIGSSSILVDGGTSLDIRNNILSNIGGGYCAYLANKLLSGTWDYNNYHNLYKRTGFLDGQTYPSFASWAGAINGESRGLSCNPFFTNDSVLVPHQILLNNAGISIPGVESDIDGIKRDQVTPDTGASEFSPCTNDAGVNAVTFPSTPANSGNQDVRVLLQNQGTNTLTSVRIDWSVNGAVQNPFNWTGSLESRKNTEIKIGSVPLQSGEIYYIKVWTSSPNGIKDCDHYNDTVMSPRIYTKLCGTFTIGGENPHFKTINEAVNVLTDAGVTCPVVFKVRDGLYLEQVEINPIPGCSVINTVTFESESGDSSKVTIMNPELYKPTITLKGARNIIFNKLGIKKEYYGNGSFLITSGAENLQISNCLITSSGISFGVVVEDSSKNISIKQNFFNGSANGGHNCIHMSDVRNIFIHKNRFTGYSSAITGNSNLNNVSVNNNETIQGGFEFNYTGDSISIISNTLYNNVIIIRGNRSKGICLVDGNKIYSSVSSGIFLNVLKCLVSNNYITIYGNSNGNGIDVIESGDIKIFNNSINVLNSNVNSSKCIQVSACESLEVKNNIFLNSGRGFCAYVQIPPIQTSWDYNNYFSLTNSIGNKTGSSYMTLTSWSTAINGEANGRNLDPYFANDSTFRVYQRGLNGAGIPVQGVLFDIENEIRNDQAPDIGCDEFMVDFGITQVISPSNDCRHSATDSLTILLRQFGDVPFTNIILAAQLDNQPVMRDTIVGTVYNDMVFTFPKTVNISNQGSYTIKCWLVGNSDDNINNDTITVKRSSFPAPRVDFIYQGNKQNLPIQFTGTASIDPPYSIASFEWLFSDGDTAKVRETSHIYKNSGTFLVIFRAYNNMGCYSEVSKQVVVEKYEVLQLTVSSKNSKCSDVCSGEIQIAASGGTSPLTLYLDNKLITAKVVSNLCAGKYSVKAVDAAGISKTAEATIITESPVSINIVADKTEGNIPLEVNFHAEGTGAASYKWYYNDTLLSENLNISMRFEEPGLQTIILVSSSGPPNHCMSSDTVRIIAATEVSIQIPNVFTPNSDEINDTFGAVTIGVKSLEMHIYDRNGRLVHVIGVPEGRWDGTMPSGTKAPPGVYYYYLKARGYDGLDYTRQGNVNLYRDMVSLIPNPVQARAELDLNGHLSGEKTISVYNVSGILMREWTTAEDVMQIDFSWLKAGLYVLKASGAEETVVVKFIKVQMP